MRRNCHGLAKFVDSPQEATPRVLKRIEPDTFGVGLKEFWWLEAESNHRHTDFQSVALPTELSSRLSIEKQHYTGLLKKNLAEVLRKSTHRPQKVRNTEIMCRSLKEIKYRFLVSNPGVSTEFQKASLCGFLSIGAVCRPFSNRR